MGRSGAASGQEDTDTLTVGAVYGAAVFAGVFEAIALHATLDGGRPTGAYLGLAVCLVLGVAASTRTRPAVARTRLLGRAALLLTIVALVGTPLIPARIAEAQGFSPSGVPVLQSILLFLFQLGWAVTRWLSVDRGVEGDARHIPAATGTVALLIGGFLLGRVDGTTARTIVDAEPAAVFQQFSDLEDISFAVETEIAGTPGSVVFAHYHTGSQPLIGLSFATKEWFRRERIDGNLRGIFERDAETDGAYRVVAPEGQVVAGVEVQADEYVSAMRIQFAPYDGTFVSPYDRTWSDWYGGYERGDATVAIDGATRPIVGLRGSGGMVLTSLSLLTPR